MATVIVVFSSSDGYGIGNEIWNLSYLDHQYESTQVESDHKLLQCNICLEGYVK